jgi:hypothetical protein
MAGSCSGSLWRDVKAMKIDKCPNCNANLTRRSGEQNDKFHALLQDISEQRQWAGQWLDVEDWKRLITAAWERAVGRQARIFPSLDGKGIDVVYQRTSRLSKEEMSELIEYATAWAVQNEVRVEA